MRIVVDFDIDNVAYEPPNGAAVGLTLLRVGTTVAEAHDLGPGDGGPIRDGNGNTVGEWKVLAS